MRVDPQNDEIVYAAVSGFGSSHLFRSENGGDSWQDIGIGLPDVPTNAVLVNPEDPANVFVGNDLGVYVTYDTGTTWEAHMEGLPDAVLAMDLVISYPDRKIRVATHGSGVYQIPLPPIADVSADEPLLSRSFRLNQNYPNPFNPVTNISYSLPRSGEVSLLVYDLLGKEVARLVDKQQEAGYHKVTWDASNVSSGVYFYRLQSGGFTQTKKMVVLK